MNLRRPPDFATEDLEIIEGKETNHNHGRHLLSGVVNASPSGKKYKVVSSNLSGVGGCGCG